MHDVRGPRPAAPTRAHARPWARGLAALVAGLLLVVAVASGATAQGSWLDAPPRPWSSAGMAIPAAPPANPAIWPPCRAQERAPTGAEEQQVAAAGWRLTSYWATQRAGEVTLVMATVNHDGMCRPWDYNAFVFAATTFAGTLAPEPMHARTTGALDEAALLPDGRIAATFRRYAPNDPLCCPSLPAAHVIYRLDATPGGPVVVPERIVVAQLPRTGSPPLEAAAAAGAALLLAGVILRRARGCAARGVAAERGASQASVSCQRWTKRACAARGSGAGPRERRPCRCAPLRSRQRRTRPRRLAQRTWAG